MNQQQFNELIQKVLSKGVIVTMQMDKDSGIIWYDMNTDMKSELLIAYDGEKCIFKARYGHTGVIDSYEELLDEVRDCQHGRDFGNATWFEILENRYNEEVI